MEIVIIGTGYVGLVSGTCLADVGHNVTCVDVDESKIQSLLDGKVPIFEPGLAELIEDNVSHQRLDFTTNLAEALTSADAIMIAVGTPEGEDGSADLQHVMAVARTIGECAEKRPFVIVKSTVPVGTCDEVERIINETMSQRGLSEKCLVASNPEFLKEGAAIDDFLRPDRIVVGVTDDAMSDLLKRMYRPFTIDDPAKLVMMDRRSSELTKYACNCMLATRISFMNELSQLCESVGANIDSIRLGMGSDPRIGRQFLYAGPGFGGSCFPKDVNAMIMTGKQNSPQLKVLEAVWQANQDQRRHVAGKVVNHFGNDLSNVKIGVWGLTFKPGTDDVRDAPAISILKELVDKGAQIVAHDPEGVENFRRSFGECDQVTYVERDYDVLSQADALVLITEWNQYRRPNWGRVKEMMTTPVVFDFRNQYDPSFLKEEGFTYYGVGRPD